MCFAIPGGIGKGRPAPWPKRVISALSLAGLAVAMLGLALSQWVGLHLRQRLPRGRAGGWSR